MNIAPVSSPSASVPMENAPALLRGRSAIAGFSLEAMRHASGAEQRAAVGAQFEAILVRQLLGPTVTSMLGSEGGAATGIYGDLLATTIAGQLSAGPGLGLGRMLESQLAARGEPPAKNSLHP